MAETQEKMENENGSTTKENKIILLTIKNAVYPITTDVIQRVANRSGQIDRIVIFKKKFVQALVEYNDLAAAQHAKKVLQDQDIYSDCCTIKVEYARTPKLNVYKNDENTWDYTIDKRHVPNKKGGGLLGERPEVMNPPFPGAPGGQGAPGQGINPGNSSYPPRPADFRAGNPGYPANVAESRQVGLPLNQFGPNQFNGAVHQDHCNSSVVMVYGLAQDQMNCDKLFNLLCVYGNVLKIKYLRTKQNTAMVQMGDPLAVDRCCQWLSGIRLYGQVLSLSPSKQLHLIDSSSSTYHLSDGSCSFVDYSNSRNHRFTSQKMAAMNRLQKPNRVLHYYNAPISFTEEHVGDVCRRNDLSPLSIKVFPLRDSKAKSSSGLLEFRSPEDAVIALVVLNHSTIGEDDSGYQTMKLCFSSTRQ